MNSYIEYVKLHKIRYLLCVIIIPIICCSFFKDYFTMYFFNENIGTYIPSVFNAYETTFSLEGFFVPLLFLIAGFPATSSFYDEYDTGSSNYQMVRVGVNVYLYRKAVLCFMSSGFVILTGISLYTLILILLGLFNGNPIIQVEDAFYLQNQPFLLMLIRNLLFAVCGALWNMLALVVSCFVGNRYLILTVPVVSYFVLERVSIFLPDYFDLYDMCFGLPSEKLIYPFNLIYSFGFFLALSVIFGIVFMKQGRRCVERERIT